MRKLAVAAVMIGLAIVPAHSQAPDKDKAKGTKTQLEIQQEEEQRRAKDIDRDYNAAIKRSRETTPKISADPWKNVRQPGPSTDKK